MQAIAHGGEGALYFQIRQSRGASEKFHGAVIDHYGGKDTRVFKEVAKTGQALAQISELTGSRVVSKAAILLTGAAAGLWKTVRGRETRGFIIWKFFEKSTEASVKKA